MGTKFGDKTAMPLLVSVRSGARDSMPGMMDTILNLGLNDQTVLALVAATKNERFAWDCYRRFVQMYGDVVMGVQKARTKITSRLKSSSTIQAREVSRGHRRFQAHRADQQELVTRFKALIKERTGTEFPQDPWKQLWGAPAPCSAPG
jgi:pyruvate,orthophosphate dikinase